MRRPRPVPRASGASRNQLSWPTPLSASTTAIEPTTRPSSSAIHRRPAPGQDEIGERLGDVRLEGRVEPVLARVVNAMQVHDHAEIARPKLVADVEGACAGLAHGTRLAGLGYSPSKRELQKDRPLQEAVEVVVRDQRHDRFASRARGARPCPPCCRSRSPSPPPAGFARSCGRPARSRRARDGGCASSRPTVQRK